MPFRFNMQRVLDYRAQLEEEAKIGFAQAQRRHTEAREALERLRTELSVQEARLYGEVIESPGERWLLEGFVRGLKADAAATETRVQSLALAQEQARKVLATRATEKKLLEKLKERRQKQYVLEERLKEQHFNDEIATLRYKSPNP